MQSWLPVLARITLRTCVFRLNSNFGIAKSYLGEITGKHNQVSSSPQHATRIH